MGCIVTTNNPLVYPIRQSLLRDFKVYAGTPVTAAELVAISYRPAIVLDRAAAALQCEELRLMGYVEAIPGFGGEYLRITRAGLQQLSPEWPRDPFIWGPAAQA